MRGLVLFKTSKMRVFLSVPRRFVIPSQNKAGMAFFCGDQIGPLVKPVII
jgi:hypothetical protein